MGILSLLGLDNSANSEKVKKMIGNGGVIIDVRSPMEFKSGHANGAKNIMHTDIKKGIKKLKKAKNTPIILYCASGSRAYVAKNILEQAGYNDVFNAKTLGKLNRLLSK